mmetsp:Transcript_29638/g.81472  ORF Transcript_29638/g.81472 Transcript_29638/m.81472 type:complete len:237 (+) Transcript_29638:313-1023(+)
MIQDASSRHPAVVLFQNLVGVLDKEFPVLRRPRHGGENFLAHEFLQRFLGHHHFLDGRHHHVLFLFQMGLVFFHEFGIVRLEGIHVARFNGRRNGGFQRFEISVQIVETLLCDDSVGLGVENLEESSRTVVGTIPLFHGLVQGFKSDQLVPSILDSLHVVAFFNRFLHVRHTASNDFVTVAHNGKDLGLGFVVGHSVFVATTLATRNQTKMIRGEEQSVGEWEPCEFLGLAPNRER